MRQFLIHLLAFCGLPLTLLVVGEAVLQGSGELWSLDRVLAYQRAHAEALYLRAVDQVFYAYKYRGIVTRHPSVIVAGSSRTMKFRAGMFGQRAPQFYNAGGLLNSVQDVDDFSSQLPPARAPALLLLGVDLWWLNDGVRPAFRFATETAKEPGLSFDDHVVALRWLAWNPRPFARELLFSVRDAPRELIGIGARRSGSGFRADGSYASSLPVPASLEDWRFVDREEPPIIARVTAASEGFPPADGVSPVRLKMLDSALARFDARHVLVVGYLPPFSSAVLGVLRADPRHARFWADFVARVPEVFRRHQFPVIDGSDLTQFGMDDRAMIDGEHADETFHLHVVRAMLGDVRVREALPGADAAIARALASPRTNYWRADLGS